VYSTQLPTNPPLSIEEFRAKAAAVEQEIGKVIVGQRDLIRQTLITLLSSGNVLLEGVPGLGKTVLVRTIGEVIGCTFSRIQFTPDLMPSDIVGTLIISEDEAGRRDFRFEPGPIFANLVLADEVNRATPRTQSALLEAMQERSVTVAKTTHRLDEPFFVLATQNPLEMEGTYPLPEAQLDRFFFKIDVDFPTLEDLGEIIRRTTQAQVVTPQTVMSGAELVAMQRLVREVPVAEHVIEYAGRLLLATHPEREDAPEVVQKYVRNGGSPRGLQTMILAGKVLALLDGRLNVSLEDVRAVAKPALRHRLILTFEAQAEGIAPDEIIEDAVKHLRARA
jgi:MoxR-like ATPase